MVVNYITIDEAERQERLAAPDTQSWSDVRPLRSAGGGGPCAVRRRVSDVEAVPRSRGYGRAELPSAR
jgi:hypothetical protein